MSLHSFLHRGDAPAAPKRITIRRRLLGRGSRLRSMSMAAGLLSLGLASFQPAHAGTITWDGVPADWFTAPSHWSNGATPLATDDAQNLTTAAMTLGQSTTVNSFLSNGAFTFNGGTFTGNQANAASTLQVNNIFTLNGGQINNFTLQAGVKQASGPVPSVVVTNSGGNGLLNTTVNANLDLATNANAFLRIQGTNTVNGTISFGTTSNGLNIYTTNDNLIIGGSGKLIGFGNVFESGSGSILTNNGTINSNANGKALTQTNSNFVNSGTAEATNGATLALNNTLINSGKLIADGAGSTLTLVGTLASNVGNTISATNGGQVLVNGVALSGTLNGVGATSLIFNNSNNNGFNNTTANINLDLATNANAFLRFQGTDTVNGTINLATTSNGLNIYTTNDNLIIGGSGKLIGFGNVFESGAGSILTNNGTINSNANGKALTQTNSNFVNSGTAEATNGATLALNNTLTNSGKLIADGAGSTLTLVGTLASNVGNTISATNGGQVLVNGVALSGTLNGVGATSLIFNNSNNNGFNNTTANINLDLATNANAFLRFQGIDTVNGTISLGTTSNGLNIYTTNDNLIIGGGSKLIGFGNVFESGSGSILTNNGTINATGGALTQTNSNFVNNGTAKATAGGTLALNNNITNNGALAATGGSILTITGTLASNTGNTINGVGGTVNINGVALSGTLNGVGATSLIFNNSNNNGLLNTTVNANLDLATNANAFLRFQGIDTVNGTISLGTTSNGLNIYTTNDNLIIGGGSKLIGFGNVFESGSGSILTNNGTINATGGALTQTNSNFVNNGTAKATNGATLALSNNIANSAGATIAATGAGSVVTLANGSTFTGTGTSNLLTASGGGQIQVNGVALRGIINTDAGTSLILNNSANNNLTGTVVNGNLSLTNDSFLRVQGTDTVNGTISLSTTSNGLDIYTTNDNLIIGGSGKLVGYGKTFEQGTGSILTNNGLVNANVSGKTLNIANSNFNNTGTTQVTNGATLSVTSNSTNSGVVNVQGGGTANFSGLTQTAGLTQVDGVLNLVNNSALTLSGTKSGGTLLGSGQIVGNVVNTNGIVSPGDSPGTLGITGNYTQGSAGTLDIEFTNSLHDLLSVTGLATTGGLLDVNYIDTSAFTGAVGSQFAFLDYGTLAAGSGPNFGFTVTGHNGFTYTVVNDAANKMLDLQIGAIGSPVPAVPEASTTLSFGLLLLLGLGGTVVATKRKKSD